MKNIVIKLISGIVLFTTIIAIYFFVGYKDKEEENPVLLSATLPVMSMTYADRQINLLHGYTMEMDYHYMRDAITPISEDRRLTINIDKYSNIIASMSYEIRSLDGERLIDKQHIDSFTDRDDKVNAVIKLTDILEPDKEYLLIVRLVTEKHGDVYYYTRIVQQSESVVAEQLEFVWGMSQSTLSSEKARDYMAYLEPDSSESNDNLATVNIKSSFSNFTWNGMNVQQMTKPVIKIKEIIDDVGCFELQYKVKAENDYNTNEYYNVTEYYRIRKSKDTIYLYVYERKAEQIFSGNSQEVSSTRINLGLDEDLNVEYDNSPTGSFVSFVKERNLWLMDMNANVVTNIFSFESGSDNDIRDVFNDNDIEIISTDGDGNVLFSVYGYMNKGGHEGKVGMGLYRYDNEKNTVTEYVFVPSSKPYYFLKGVTGKFACLKDNNTLYMMIEDSIYTVSLDSNEYVQLVSGLERGNYIISDDNNIIAWHENTTKNNATSIRVININTGDDYVINAPEGDYVKVIGFIDQDLIYGIGNSEDVYTDSQGEEVLPMYRLCVMLEDKKEQESYEKPGIYVTSAQISGNMLNLKRVTKDASGMYTAVSDDQYMNKNAAREKVVSLTTIVTDLKKTQLVIKFAYTVAASGKLVKDYPEQIQYVSDSAFEPDEEKKEDNNYYVYCDGQMELVTPKLSEAINTAYDKYGVIVDSKGKTVWARASKLNDAGLDAKPYVGLYTSFDVVKNSYTGTVYDISGAVFDSMFYYTTKGIPVLMMVDGRGLCCVDAYKGFGGNINIVYFTDLNTGEEFDMSYGEAEKIYNSLGRHYMVFGS